MIQLGVPVVLLDAALNGTPGLSNADLTIFAGVAINATCFEAEVILDGPKDVLSR
jgi:hypothetical protein